MNLRVRVTDDLVLDAGTCEPVSATEQVIHAPSIPLFEQVLAYLRAKPDPPSPPKTSIAEPDGVAAAAVTLRWGSYLAVIADTAKPVWSEARSPGTSRISDSEMARINIEASGALARWVDILREDAHNYEKLVTRALAYLPVPKVRTRPEGTDFVMLAVREVAAKLATASAETLVTRVRADAERYPSRVFANALVNVAWRNGPAENVHAGVFRGYPLDRRRVTVAEERALVGFAACRMATGIQVCRDLAEERPARSWPEQVLPYGLAGGLITPSGWTLTETTRELRLPRS